MIYVQGRVRDYAPATDTCSVELDGLGVIDSWADGVAIDPAVNRSFLYHGGRCTLAVHDPHRLDELVVVATADNPKTPQHYTGATKMNSQLGRAVIATAADGSGTVAVTFSPAYTSVSTVIDLRASSDNNLTFTITNILATGFTLNLAAGAGPASSYAYFSWQATGY